MTELCSQEIDNAVREAAASGEILFVAQTARRIAALCNTPGDAVAKQLTEAGIRAGVTMQFGSPDRRLAEPTCSA